jgi:hypothetical protein
MADYAGNAARYYGQRMDAEITKRRAVESELANLRYDARELVAAIERGADVKHCIQYRDFLRTLDG